LPTTPPLPRHRRRHYPGVRRIIGENWRANSTGVNGVDADVVAPEFVGKRLPLLLKYVCNHNVPALRDETARVTGAHSTGAARDDHCPIIKTFHDFSPLITFSIQRTLLIVDTIQLRLTVLAVPTLAPHFPRSSLPLPLLHWARLRGGLFASLLQYLVRDLSSLSKCLQTAFLNEALFDQRYVRLGIAQRGVRRVDRVRAEDEVILVRGGRAENEFSVAPRLELDRFARWLESRQVAAPQLVGNRYGA
jgi:hypothetical protein